jgi:hypothetical protein
MDDETNSKADDNAAFRQTLDDVFEFFVRPEVERRSQAGTLDAATTGLSAFQVLFPSDGQPIVRINEEVRVNVTLSVDASRKMDNATPQTMQPGDRIEEIYLPPTEEPTFAHFTACRVDDTWYFTFDLRHQKAPAREHLLAAEEFFSAAEKAAASGQLRAFVDNAYSCIELISKVELFLVNQISTGRMQHPKVHAKANLVLGSDPLGLHRLLKALWDLRYSARYLLSPFQLTAEEVAKIMVDVVAVMQRARGNVRQPGPQVRGTTG